LTWKFCSRKQASRLTPRIRKQKGSGCEEEERKVSLARPRIALIHAVTVAIEPIVDAFARAWPEARLVNILEDSLGPDRAHDPNLTDTMTERIELLARYALKSAADAILFTCSAFGPAIERTAAQLPIPVLKPNEAMFEAALGMGEKIGMLATFAPSVATMEAEFREESIKRRPGAHLTTILVNGALEALKNGDQARHNELVAECAPSLASSDAIVLAHFSTSRAAQRVRAVLDRPVLTSPDAAVGKLKRLLGAAQ
jgi:Asp/Glu/hydantoin racemase